MKYIKSTAPCGCCSIILGRNMDDVRSRIEDIKKYVVSHGSESSKITVAALTSQFDDHEGHTRSDVVSALLELKEEGKISDIS